MIITTRAVLQGKKNDKDWPSFYTVNFLEPGMVNYADVGAGMNYLGKEAILGMLQSFVGKPVIDEMHVDVTPETFKQHAVGYITRVWFDHEKNWAMCDFILTDDKAKANVAKGYSVSCAYDQCITGPGGERNAVKFHEEILGGMGNHLALVTSPRYESCVIQPCMMLVNSKKATIQRNDITVKVTNATKGSTEVQEKAEEREMERICDSCEYLVQGVCQVAGPAGEITQRYADLRLHGEAKDCSAYDKAEGRRENFVVVKTVNS